MQDYSESLKEKLIESYTCFVHSLYDSDKDQILLNHFPKLLEFIHKASDQKLNPTVVKNIIINFFL